MSVTVRFRSLLIGCCLFLLSDSQLIVNVKDNGGEVLQEIIDSNTTSDIVTLLTKKYDGTVILQTIDFGNGVQLFKILLLDEPAFGFTQHQTLCFVIRFTKNEFISSDAMSKLRQKNPDAVRHAEEDKGTETYVLDMRINYTLSHYITPHIKSQCSLSNGAIYTRDSDLSLLAKAGTKDHSTLLSAVSHTPFYQVSGCPDVPTLEQPCLCRYTMCIAWFPCGLKYCKGMDSAGKMVSYRCGIKTCSKCWHFLYYTDHRRLCLWDENTLTNSTANVQPDKNNPSKI